MTKFWETGSFEQELMKGMENAQLQSIASEEQHEESLIVRAMEELNAAAESFERAGRTARAKEVTTVMMSLAEDDKKPTPEKESSKDEARKVFMFFGFGPKDLEGLDLSSSDDGDDKNEE
jgi:hypothetical protein